MYSSICSKRHFSSSRYACGSAFCMVIYFTEKQGKRLICPQMNAKNANKNFFDCFLNLRLFAEKLFSLTKDTVD